MPTLPFSISVIMCTRNRAEQLRRVLHSAAEMSVPEGLDWEFLLIDNGSSDHTAEVVAGFAGALPIRHIYEPEAGLSNARNRGVREARGDYICWTDDDVIIDPGWLSAYAAAFEANPEAVLFGGHVEPCFESDPPQWWSENYRSLAAILAERDFGPDTRKLSYEDDIFPYGANFAIRAIEQRQHLYDPNLGVGRWKRLGEETALLGTIARQGGTGIWVSQARVRHIIPSSRLTIDYVGTYSRSAGETWAYLCDSRKLNFMGPSLPEGAAHALGVPLRVLRRAIFHWLRYQYLRTRCPSSRWLNHWRQYNYHVGAIEYWRRSARGGGCR